ncbi:MAG: hypothetical protein WBF77_02685 [Sulfurimonadaceae bacterium]
MTFEQQWIEYDYNPFVLFSASGKIISLNNEAQYLLGSVDKNILFEIATTHASTSFGFKTTFLELEFGRYRLFGITVGYENESEIGIRFYQQPTINFSAPKPTGELINVYTLIDLCISTCSISSDTIFKKDLDPTIPEIRLHPENFIKLFNKIYGAYVNSDVIKTKLFYRVGEHIKFEDNKYSLFTIEISGTEFCKKSVSEIEMLAETNNLYSVFQDNVVSINIPMITD